MNVQALHPMPSKNRLDWRVPAVLLALGLVPLAAGILRLAGLATGGPVTPENARFLAAPWPVVAHIVAATLFCNVGAFQFESGLRRRYPGWHRIAGQFLLPCGLIAATSGLWMTVMYPLYPQLQGALLYGARIGFGTAMILFLGLAMTAIWRRDIAHHRAWMIRGYALGQGAGTQVLVALPGILIFGKPGGLTRDLLMAAAWIINLAFAEWIIRRPPR